MVDIVKLKNEAFKDMNRRKELFQYACDDFIGSLINEETLEDHFNSMLKSVERCDMLRYLKVE